MNGDLPLDLYSLCAVLRQMPLINTARVYRNSKKSVVLVRG